MTTKPQNFLTEEQDLFTNLFANTFASTWVHPTLVVSGTDEDDALTGSTRRDTLNGGLGADTMTGLGGADTYVVDNVGDVVVEAKGGSIDTVLASVSYTLAKNVENLTLTGHDNIKATGNNQGNILIGNDGNNIISGLGGNDTFQGAIDSSSDTLDGGSGDDTFNNIISGYIEGGEGNDCVSISGMPSTQTFWTGKNAVRVDATSDFAHIKILVDSGSFTLGSTFFNITKNFLTLNSIENISVLHGGSGDDLIFALGNGTTYDGGSGQDTFYANWSTATNNITWVNDGSAQVVNGTTISGMERLLITTGSGDDYIESRTYNLNTANYISTGAGNDTLVGENYAATLDGGSGDDTFNNIISGYIEGGEGNDSVSISGMPSTQTFWTGQNGVRVDATSDFAHIKILVDSGSFTLGSTFFNITKNFLTLNSIENISVLHGGSGDDLIFALGNGTTYDGGSGQDTFYANWSTATNNITW